MTKDALRRIHGCRKQHSKHKAPMQSQKAGNEPEQTESAVEDDVHNLGETYLGAVDDVIDGGQWFFDCHCDFLISDSFSNVVIGMFL